MLSSPGGCRLDLDRRCGCARYAAASAPLRPPITFSAPRARPPRAEQAHESFVCNLKLGLHRGLRNVVATIRQLRSTIITLVDRGLIGGAQRSKASPRRLSPPSIVSTASVLERAKTRASAETNLTKIKQEQSRYDVSLEVGDPEDMDEGLTATLNFTTIDNRECARVAGSARTLRRAFLALFFPAVQRRHRFKRCRCPPGSAR